MKKEKEIKIRVTAEEYDRLKKAAEKDNETLSNYDWVEVTY